MVVHKKLEGWVVALYSDKLLKKKLENTWGRKIKEDSSQKGKRGEGGKTKET